MKRVISVPKHHPLSKTTIYGESDLNKTIEILTRGREIFNIEKPEFKIGNKASLALFTINDYEFSKTDILSKSKNSAFLGMKMKGKAVGIINENMVTINE